MQLKNNDFELRVSSAGATHAYRLASLHASLRPYLSEPANYYPGFHSWYQKVYWQLLFGSRFIITVHRKNTIAGFAIVKQTEHENKVCTFKIDKQYRNNGLASELMLAALAMLHFRNVLITIPDFYHEDFSPLMTKFGFLRMHKKRDAYTKNHSEYFYALNPYLPLCGVSHLK